MSNFTVEEYGNSFVIRDANAGILYKFKKDSAKAKLICNKDNDKSIYVKKALHDLSKDSHVDIDKLHPRTRKFTGDIIVYENFTGIYTGKEIVTGKMNDIECKLNLNTKKFNFILATGDEYEGDIIDGFPNGEGTITMKDDKEIISKSGTFVNGLLNGEGKIKAHKYTLQGTFADGKLNGNGVKKITEKDKRLTYYGVFKDNELHGEGKIMYDNGNTYAGTFVNGKKHGQFTNKIGNKIIKSNYVNGSQNGTAIMMMNYNGVKIVEVFNFTKNIRTGPAIFDVETVENGKDDLPDIDVNYIIKCNYVNNAFDYDMKDAKGYKGEILGEVYIQKFLVATNELIETKQFINYAYNKNSLCIIENVNGYYRKGMWKISDKKDMPLGNGHFVGEVVFNQNGSDISIIEEYDPTGKKKNKSDEFYSPD